MFFRQKPILSSIFLVEISTKNHEKTPYSCVRLRAVPWRAVFGKYRTFPDAEAYTTGTFNENYRPTLFDNYRASVTLAGEQRVNLDLFDTSGTAKYDGLRQISYQNANVVLVCFSLLSKSSFKNVKSKWMKEVEQFCPGTNVVLVMSYAILAIRRFSKR